MAVTPNYYETFYLVRPDLKDEDLAKIQQKLQDSISANEGSILRDEKWAERDLAYEIQDHKRGIYYILVFNALPNASREVENHLKFYNTDVLRFMTLKITEEAANKNISSQEKTEEKEPTTPPAAPTPPTPPQAPPSTQEAAPPQAGSTQEEGGTN